MDKPDEYKIVCRYLRHPGGGKRIFDFTHEDNQQNLTEAINDSLSAMRTELSEMRELGWQISSHSISFHDDVCILSILIEHYPT